MFAKDHTIAKVDPELWSAIQQENTRQQDHIELTAMIRASPSREPTRS